MESILEQNNILISVVVPFFNVNHDLFLKCIDSILKQTHNNIEIIVIDDGSEKENAIFLDNILKQDGRIRVYHQKNKGVSETRNYGVSLSCGKYLTFVDADDVIVPYFLQEALEIIERENADEVLGARIVVDDLNEKCEKRDKLVYQTLSGKDRFKFKTYLLGHLCCVGDGQAEIGRGPVARLLKTDLIRKIRFDPKLTIGEDQIWNLELLNICDKICYVDQIWYKYFRNSESVTHKFNPLIVQWCEENLNRMPNYVDMENDTEYESYVCRILEELYSFVYVGFLAHKDKMGRKERQRIVNHVYSTSPWKEIGNKRFWILSTRKNAVKGILFRTRLLILYWDFKRKIKRLLNEKSSNYHFDWRK